jgi:hypothetical protein
MSEQEGTERGHHHNSGYEQGYNAGYGAPGYGAPGYGAPAPGYGVPAPAYGAPAYGAPAPGYGAPGYGAPAPAYGAPGYGAAPSGYTAPTNWTQQFQGNINWESARIAFDKVDANHSGSIDWAELRHALSEIGYKNDEETVKALMSMYDADRSGHLDFNEFAQLTGYLAQSGQQFQKHSTGEGQMSQNQVFEALAAQHGGFLNRIGGSVFVQSLIVHFDRHRTGYIGVGVFLTIVAIIGVLRMLHERNQLPQENFDDPSQHQGIIQRIMAYVNSFRS